MGLRLSSFGHTPTPIPLLASPLKGEGRAKRFCHLPFKGSDFGKSGVGMGLRLRSFGRTPTPIPLLTSPLKGEGLALQSLPAIHLCFAG
jgi:hypothetical protein